MHTFDTLGVGKTTTAELAKHAITAPTPIQELTLPPIFMGKDVIAQAETGSGKTLSFALPLIERTGGKDGISALILAPTRELVIQIAHEFDKFSPGRGLGVTPVYGGVASGPQIKKMQKTQIVVATPGRLLDLLEQKALTLSGVRTLILDEADRMLDMGFLPDIERIVRQIPKERQTLLFSATISKEIVKISKRYMRDPEEVRLASELKPEYLRQTYYQTTPDIKLQLLLHLLGRERDLALVFCNRKHIARKIARKISQQGIHARALQGDMTQGQRERATKEFREKKFNVLVATDVAARGLHIDGISHVYNYEIPKDVESFTHRVGRTARAGRQGEAISLVATDDERKFFEQILFRYNGKIDLKSVEKSDLPQLLAAIPQAAAPTRREPRRQGGRRRRR